MLNQYILDQAIDRNILCYDHTAKTGLFTRRLASFLCETNRKNDICQLDTVYIGSSVTIDEWDDEEQKNFDNNKPVYLGNLQIIRDGRLDTEFLDYYLDICTLCGDKNNLIVAVGHMSHPLLGAC
jgi:predicted restriction endonuclease